MKVIVRYKKINLGFEVLTAAVIKNSVFWDIKPPIPLKVNNISETHIASSFRVEE
jgi:hypothetical protein